ncbi:MAG: hypothetical protein A3G26_10890 [Betaproteobacteria bacterium RIFCSPLOWO2_12_FULL_65_110]|nr:MAG: hypothetical protein A3G26_10890 [Betaproteobacteria bacterium RIFCSPLOWO2_12_FULL_65_110]
MKPNRKVQRKQVSAEVISLAAYREAHRGREAEAAPEPVGAGGVSLMDAYCRWLALAGALWTFWW